MKKQLPEEEKKKIARLLKEKGASLSCPMCGNRNFILANGYFNHPIQTELKGMVLGGPSIPTIGLICSNCGFTSQHALGALGLLNKMEGGNE